MQKKSLNEYLVQFDLKEHTLDEIAYTVADHFESEVFERRYVVIQTDEPLERVKECMSSLPGYLSIEPHISDYRPTEH